MHPRACYGEAASPSKLVPPSPPRPQGSLLETVPDVCSSNSIKDSTTGPETSRKHKVGKADAAIELARRSVATADHPGRAPCLARESVLRTADPRMD